MGMWRVPCARPPIFLVIVPFHVHPEAARRPIPGPGQTRRPPRGPRSSTPRREARPLAAELVLEFGGGGVRRNPSGHRRRHAHRPPRRPGRPLVTHLPPRRHRRRRPADRRHTRFAGRPVRDVTPAVVLALYRDCPRRLEPWRVKRVHAVLPTAFQMAIPYGWTNANPCRDVAPPTPEKANLNPPTDEPGAGHPRRSSTGSNCSPSGSTRRSASAAATSSACNGPTSTSTGARSSSPAPSPTPPARST